jgi:hypothetical protein
MNPTEHVIFTLAFHLTKSPDFTLDVIKRGLQVAQACAMDSTSSDEFKALMETRANQIHNLSEDELRKDLDHG